MKILNKIIESSFNPDTFLLGDEVFCRVNNTSENFEGTIVKIDDYIYVAMDYPRGENLYDTKSVYIFNKTNNLLEYVLDKSGLHKVKYSYHTNVKLYLQMGSRRKRTKRPDSVEFNLKTKLEKLSYNIDKLDFNNVKNEVDQQYIYDYQVYNR